MYEKVKKYLVSFIKYAVIFIIAINFVSYYNSLDLNKDKLSIKSFELINNFVYKVNTNKPLVVHFWATWCPICALEEKNIQNLSKDYEVVTVAVQSGSNEKISKYLKKNNLSFNVVNDEFSNLAQQFNIKAFPTTFIYDKNQNLKFSEVGYTSNFGLKLRVWLSH